MQIGSTTWLVLIVLGAAAVALGNVQYNKARDREKEISATETAFSMLKSEMKHNLDFIQQMRSASAQNQAFVEPFQTSAWTVVSNAGLLKGVDEGRLNNILEVYHLIGLADRYRSQIVEFSVGVQSALGNAVAIRGSFNTALLAVLDKLEPKLKNLLENPTTN